MESVLPPETASGAGFERTTIRQFNIFLENRVGRLSRMLRSLEDGGQPVNAISIEESADAALVRLICADADTGRQCLLEAGFSFSESAVIAVAMPRHLQFPLISVCQALLSAEINIHYMYPMLRCRLGAAVVLYVDDRTLAAQILVRKGFNLVGESDLSLRPLHDDDFGK
jgi:hypothetical protein